MRVITHSDFDGLFSALLMCEITGIDPENVIVMQHWQIRKDEFEFKPSDFVVDLPRPKEPIEFWADHHVGDSLDEVNCKDFAYDSKAKSCAGVIYKKFAHSYPQIEKYSKYIHIVDKIDSASYTLEDFRNHDKFSIMSLSLKTFDREMDKYYFKFLLKHILSEGFRRTAEKEWVKARYQYKLDSIKRWKEAIKPFIQINDGVIIVDTREVEQKFPKGSSIHLFEEHPETRVAIIISTNYFNGTSIHVGENPFFKDRNNVHIGHLMQKYGGGGHKGVGGCELKEDSENAIQEIVDTLKKN